MSSWLQKKLTGKEEMMEGKEELLSPLSLGITSSCTIGLFLFLFPLKKCVYMCLSASQRTTWERTLPPSFYHVVPRDQTQVLKFGSSTYIHWATVIRHLTFYYFCCMCEGRHTCGDKTTGNLLLLSRLEGWNWSFRFTRQILVPTEPSH